MFIDIIFNDILMFIVIILNDIFKVYCYIQLEIHSISKDDFDFLIMGLFQHSED